MYEQQRGGYGRLAGETQPRPGHRIIMRESSMLKMREQGRIRLICVAFVFALSFMAIGSRLAEIAFDQFLLTADGANSAEDIAGGRGGKTISRSDIVDRNGEVLATTLATQSAFARPRIMLDREKAAQQLAEIFPDIDAQKLLKKFSSGRSFVYIKRHLTPEQQQRVNDLGIPGVYFEPDKRRVYPYGNLFSHVVGYVDVDNNGLAGVERYYQDLLNSQEEEAGEALQLSLDVRLQNIVHAELSKGVEEFNAVGGTAIIADVNSGEILALVNLPDFDPQHPAESIAEAKFNRAALGVYEMGSTFKTFTVAMALDEGIVGMNDGYDATNPIKISRFTIRDSHPKKRWLSVPEIFAYSSNIGTVKMAMEVGAKRQKQFLSQLGFFEPVDIELPAKGKPLIPDPWREINMMTISYGHGISVTPLHLVRALAAMVNGGKLNPLTLVKNGNSVGKTAKQVISETTSRQLRRLLRLVVEYGTGRKAAVAGYRVGGKTGTAEKVKAGHYRGSDKIASFVGIFPMDDPKYVVLVMVDEPRGNKSTYGYATGGWIAAPVAGRIISRMAPLLGVRPVLEIPEDDINRPWIHKAQRRFLHAARY